MPARFELECRLDCNIDEIWGAIERPALFVHVAGPLVVARATMPDSWPEKWEEREYRAAMRLFGIVPIGWQAIVVSFPQIGPDHRILCDNGYGPMLKTWQHQITVSRDGEATLYSDRVEFDAGALTAIAAPAIRFFFRHRQKRLKALVKRGLASLTA